MGDPLVEAVRALKRAEAVLERRKRELNDSIASEVRAGVRLSDVAKRTGFTREYVRRVARAAGIEGDANRQPPPPRYRRDNQPASGGVAGPYSDLFE